MIKDEKQKLHFLAFSSLELGNQHLDIQITCENKSLSSYLKTSFKSVFSVEKKGKTKRPKERKINNQKKIKNSKQDQKSENELENKNLKKEIFERDG